MLQKKYLCYYYNGLESVKRIDVSIIGLVGVLDC